MKQNFTPNQLIQCIYHETSASETLAVKEALAKDPLLREEYEELFRGYQYLPKVKFSPADQTLKQILSYSKRAAMSNHA